MNHLLIIFFISIIFTNPFNGRVVDEAGNPISGANVELLSSDRGTSTDQNGLFTIDNPNGNSIRISHIGYSSKTINFSEKGDSLSQKNSSKYMDIVLSESRLDTNPVVVTGSRRESYIKDVPVKTHVINIEDIRSSGVSSVKDLLEVAIPNVQNVMSSHAGISNNEVKIQGLDNKYMLFLVDGARISGEFAGNLDFNMLNLSNVERIEVIEGGMSSLYGSSAIGGVVNIITKKNKAPFKLEVSYFYDKPMVLSKYLNLGFNFKDISYSLNLSNQESDGYDLTPHSDRYEFPLKTLEEYNSFTINHNLKYYLGRHIYFNLNYKSYQTKTYQYQNHLVQLFQDYDEELYPNANYTYSSLRNNNPWFEDDEYKFELNYNKDKSKLIFRYHEDNYQKTNYFYNYTELDCDNDDEYYFCLDQNNLTDREFVNAKNLNKNFLIQYDFNWDKNSFFSIGYERNKNNYSSYNIYSQLGDLGNGIYDEGEEFEDTNGNGFFDSGESFTDSGFFFDNQGVYDSGEEFIDCDILAGICEGDDGWDSETMGNGEYDGPEEFTDIGGDGLCLVGDCLVESIFGAVNGTKKYIKEAVFIGGQISLKDKSILSLSLRNVNSKNYGENIVYSMAYMIKGEKYNYRINHSKGFRIPAIKELYYDFQSHPPPIMGNPDLKSTTNKYYSASAEKRIRNQAQSIEIYYNNVKNMIGTNYIYTDLNNDEDFEDEGETIITYNNFKQVDIMGLNLNYELSNNKNGVKLIYNYTNPISNQDSPLELISKKSMRLRYRREIIENKLNLFYNVKYAGEKFVLSPNYKYDSDENFVDCNETMSICEGDDNWSPDLGNGYYNDGESFEDNIRKLYLDSYFISDIILSLTPNKYISINIGCKNIFDYTDQRRFLENESLRNILSNYDPGRRYFFELKFNF